MLLIGGNGRDGEKKGIGTEGLRGLPSIIGTGKLNAGGGTRGVGAFDGARTAATAPAGCSFGGEGPRGGEARRPSVAVEGVWVREFGATSTLSFDGCLCLRFDAGLFESFFFRDSGRFFGVAPSCGLDRLGFPFFFFSFALPSF